MGTGCLLLPPKKQENRNYIIRIIPCLRGWPLQLHKQSQRERNPSICGRQEELAVQVEMAKAHDLNIYGYLKFLLDHRPVKEMTDNQLAELAPWSKKLHSI